MDSEWQPTDVDPESGLATAVLEFAERTADDLARFYPRGDADPSDFDVYDDVDNEVEFYEREKGIILDNRNVNWWVENSERIVVCIGNTFDGDFSHVDRHGVVLKFQPHLRVGSEIGTGANREAVRMYEKAQEVGDEDLFPTFFDYADDRSWIAMEYYTPILTGTGSKNPPYDTLHCHGVELERIKERFRERGWYGNYTGGNIGVSSDGTVVLIDIGGHTEYRPKGESTVT